MVLILFDSESHKVLKIVKNKKSIFLKFKIDQSQVNEQLRNREFQNQQRGKYKYFYASLFWCL